MSEKKQRSDGWTVEQDQTLAETILSFVREGNSIKEAQEAVAEKMNRTLAAVGFRWNQVLRKNYVQAIALAKKEGAAFKKNSVSGKAKNVTGRKKKESPIEMDAAPSPEVTVNQEAAVEISTEPQVVLETVTEEINVPVAETKTAPVAETKQTANVDDFVASMSKHINEFIQLQQDTESLTQKLTSKDAEVAQLEAKVADLEDKLANVQPVENNDNKILAEENQKLKERITALEKDLEDFVGAVRRFERRTEVMNPGKDDVAI